VRFGRPGGLDDHQRAQAIRRHANGEAVVALTDAPISKTEQLDFLREIYRKAAVRYALMAEEAEKPDTVRGGVSLWDRAEQLLA